PTPDEKGRPAHAAKRANGAVDSARNHFPGAFKQGGRLWVFVVHSVVRSLVCFDERVGSGGTQFTNILREVQRVWDDSRYAKSTQNFGTVFMPQSRRATEDRGSKIGDRRSSNALRSSVLDSLWACG